MQLKHLLHFSTSDLSHCYNCSIPFLIHYGCDTYGTCPICGEDQPQNHRYDNKNTYIYDELGGYYCFNCHIVYNMGCEHLSYDCCTNYNHSLFYVPRVNENGKLITLLKDLKIPIFTDFDEANTFLQDHKDSSDYHWVCLYNIHGSKKYCPKARYPQDEKLSYYKCEYDHLITD